MVQQQSIYEENKMPGLTNRRNAIREGKDWVKSYNKGGKVTKAKKKGPGIKGHGYGPYVQFPSKAKGYKTGGKVKLVTGSGSLGVYSDPIAKAAKSPIRKKKSR